MNETIDDFISSLYTPDFVSLIKKAFSLFEAFEHQNAYDGMMDAINNESVSDTAARSDHFVVELNKQLDYVLGEHLVILTGEATVRDRVDILDALYRAQHLEDYTVINNILESEQDAIDKMAAILSDLTSDEEARFLTILQDVDRRVLELLRQFIANKDATVPEDHTPTKIANRFRLFVDAVGGGYIGSVLVEAGMILGLNIRFYLPFVMDHLLDEQQPNVTAGNVLSVLYLSDTDEQQMLTQFREISENIFKSLEDVGKVEAEFIKLLSRIEEIRKVNHEKAGLSQAGN